MVDGGEGRWGPKTRMAEELLWRPEIGRGSHADRTPAKLP